MVPRRSRRRSLALLLGLGLSALAPRASSAPLGEADVRSLERGEVVRRNVDLELDQGAYFGGVAYAIIERAPSDVIAALDDPSSYRSILPVTREASPRPFVGKAPPGVRRFRFTHGGRIATASYTVLVRHESRHVVRFWLDPSEAHDIADCWGYFRVTPWGKGRSLLTYGALVRLDFGVVKLLLTEKIRDFALSTPALVKRYVEARGAPPAIP